MGQLFVSVSGKLLERVWSQRTKNIPAMHDLRGLSGDAGDDLMLMACGMPPPPGAPLVPPPPQIGDQSESWSFGRFESSLPQLPASGKLAGCFLHSLTLTLDFNLLTLLFFAAGEILTFFISTIKHNKHKLLLLSCIFWCSESSFSRSVGLDDSLLSVGLPIPSEPGLTLEEEDGERSDMAFLKDLLSPGPGGSDEFSREWQDAFGAFDPPSVPAASTGPARPPSNPPSPTGFLPSQLLDHSLSSSGQPHRADRVSTTQQ